MKSHFNIRTKDRFDSTANRFASVSSKLCFQGFWQFRAYFPRETNDPRETLQLKWEDEFENLVVNEGLNHILDIVLSGGTQLTTWYLGLINGSSPTIAAGNTYASHGGWSENTNYSQSNRPTWSDAGPSSQSITNSASPATFSINSNGQTIGGAFLASNNTKGDTAASGARLYAAGAFASAKALDNGETLTVTATFTAADDGV